MKVLLASGNPGKLSELLPYFPEWELAIPEVPFEVEETESTFEGNARLKAEALRNATGMPALADDSGLCVEALQGAPGVRSHRYGPDDQARNARLLQALQGIPHECRAATFRCALALALPDGPTLVGTGELQGVIAMEPRGTGGFGYDPLFYLPELGKTLAQLAADQKAKLSHRGRAIAALRTRIFP